MTMQLLQAQLGGDASGFQPPKLNINQRPPRGVYLIPIRKIIGGKPLIVGERLTPIEDNALLSLDPRDVKRYERKGCRIATASDIARLKDKEGRMVMYEKPVYALLTSQEAMANGRITGDPQAEEVLKNRIKELEQQLALKNQPATFTTVDAGITTFAGSGSTSAIVDKQKPIFTETCGDCTEFFTSTVKSAAKNKLAAHKRKAHAAPA